MFVHGQRGKTVTTVYYHVISHPERFHTYGTSGFLAKKKKGKKKKKKDVNHNHDNSCFFSFSLKQVIIVSVASN